MPVEIFYGKTVYHRIFFNSLHRLWKDDVANHGEQKASFFRVCWRFSRTRLIVAGLVYWLCLCMGFLGPVGYLIANGKVKIQMKNEDEETETKQKGKQKSSFKL